MNNTKSRDSYNILYIFADQMHGFAMGCMGNTDVKTPNLDRLASEGVLFRNTYTNAPVCTPYRGVLLTGKYASQTGVTGNCHALPRGIPTIADRLNEGGYRTSYVGKWHLGDTGNIAVSPELRGGFQDFIGYQCYNDYLSDVWFFDEQGRRHTYEKHRTDATTDVALERLDSLADSRFALFVSYQNPHYPVQPSPEYEALYAGATITRRPNVMPIDPYTRTQSPPVPDPGKDPNYLKYGNNLDEYIRLYYAMITQLDSNIGRIMARLEQLGLAENTVLMFTSDHGDMQGSHGLKNKQVFWEESTRVPLIVRVPNGLQGSTSEALISTVDFYPAIMEYCGLDEVPDMEGTSFARLTFGDSRTWKDEVYSEDGKWIMVRKGNYKLVADNKTYESTHLFDLSSDPYEMANIVGEFPELTEQLKIGLVAWHSRMLQTSLLDK